jgi:ATP:ADP antiporter, AAA family
MSQPSEPGWLSRGLRPFADVRLGEAATALLLTLNVFLLLSAYYVIKPVREALILELASGAEYKAYMSGAIAVALLVLVPAYAKLVDRLPRIKLVVLVTLAFAVQLLLFFLAAQAPALRSELGLVFYVWVGIFNMMVVAQFWAFANDLYDAERGARLFPMVALGASVGAAVGSKFSALLIPLIGVSPMLLVAAGLLVTCSALFFWVERREADGMRARPAAPSAPQSSGGAFGLVLSHRYLLLVALFSLVFSWVNTNGEYMLGKLIKASAVEAVRRGEILPEGQGAFIGKTYGDFFFYVNVAGVFLQSFVVSRLVKKLGFGIAFLIMPAIALTNALSVAVVPVLSVLRVGKTVENATDYSLNNTLRQMLWLVTSSEMKFKAKQAIDAFFVRLGDVSSAVSVWLFASVLVLPLQGFAWLSALLCGAWLVLALMIGRENSRLRVAPLEAAP